MALPFREQHSFSVESTKDVSVEIRSANVSPLLLQLEHANMFVRASWS